MKKCKVCGKFCSPRKTYCSNKCKKYFHKNKLTKSSWRWAEARKQYTRFLPYINKNANKWSHYCVGTHDLKQAALIGIYQALPAFKKHRGKYKNFIYTCIRNAMLCEAVAGWFIEKVPPGSLHVVKERKLATSSRYKIVDTTVEDDFVEEVDIMDLLDTYDKNNLVYLNKVCGFNYKEIKQITKTSTSTVSRQTNETIKKINEHICN